MKLVISEEMVHEAVHYLSTEGNAAAVAKGNQVRAEYHRRKIRASLILASPHSSQGLREAYADSHGDYAEVCEKLAQCEEEVERRFWQRKWIRLGRRLRKWKRIRRREWRRW